MATVAELLVVISSDVDDAKKGIDSVSDRIDKLEQKNSKGGGFGALEQIAVGAMHKIGETAIDLAGGALSKIWEFFAGGIKMAGDYEQSMNRVQAITGATDAQMAKLDATAVRLGETFGKANAKDAMDTLEVLTSRGMTAEQALGAVEGSLQLATAAQISYNDAAVITSNILDAYKKDASEAGSITDLLAATSVSSGSSITDLGQAMAQVGTVAHAFGLSATETAAALGMMGKAGIEGSDAGTSLKSMLMALQNPSDKAKELMEQFGISVYNADGSIKSLNGIIEEFTKLQVGSQVTIHATADELEKYQKQADSAQKKIVDLGESNSQIAQRMADDQAKLTDMAESYSIRRSQAEQDYHDKIADIEQGASQQRLDIANDLSNKLADIETSHATKVQQIAQGGNDKRADIERDLGDKLADIANDYTAKAQDIESNFQDKLAAIQSSASQKRADIERDYGDKRADLATSYASKVADIEASYAQKGTDASNKYYDTVERLEADHIKRLGDIQSKIVSTQADYQQEALRNQQDYQYKLMDMQRDYEASQKKAADNFALSQLDRQMSHEDKQADITDQYGDKITDLQAQLAKARRSADKKALQDQINEAIAARDSALAEEASDYQRQEDQAKRHYDLQVQQAKDAYAQQQVELEEKRKIEEQRRKEEYDAQQLALTQQLTAETQAYEDRRVAAKTAYDAQVADLRAAQATALTAAQAAYTQQQTAAKTAYDRQLSDLQLWLQRQTDAETTGRTEALADAQADQQTRLADAQTAHQRALDDLATALQRQTDTEQAAYTQQRTNAQAANTEKLADVQSNQDQQLQKLDDGYTKQEARASAAYQRSFTELSGQVHQRATEMQGEMDKNNTAITQQQGVLDGLNHTIETHGEKLVTVTQQMRDATAGTIFGSDGVRAYNTVVAGGLPLYDDMAVKVGATGKAALLADAQLKGMNGATAGLQSNVETLQLEMGKDILPHWTSLVREANKALTDLSPVIKDLNERYIVPAMAKLAEFAKGFNEAGDKVQYIKNKINENKQPVIDAISGLLQGLLTKADEYTPQISDWATRMLGAIATKIGEKAPSIGQSLIDGLWQQFKTDNLNDPIFGPLYKWMGNVWKGITEFWGIHSPSTKMAEIGTNLIDGMWNGLSNAGGKITGFMTNLGMTAKDKLQEWTGAFQGVGTNLIEGLSNGISNRWNQLRDMIYGFAGQLPQWFKDQLGIHSPSTVMAEIGKWIPAGLEVGISANADSARNAVSNLTSDLGASATIGMQAAQVSTLGTNASYAAASAATGASSVAPAINVYLQVDGHVMTERDLIETVRDGLKEYARRNGIDLVI